MSGPLVVICALEWELAHLRTLLASETAPDVVLVVTGMGMVSAAAATQEAITRHAPRAVVNYGCAGAHRLELLPGDVVVGEHVVAYDNYRETPQGALEYHGMYFFQDGAQQHIERLDCDAHLVDAARRVAEAMGDGHEPWPAELGWPASVAHRSPRVVFGTVASADRWNRSATSIEGVVARHGSVCEDMEAAAIGLVCASHRVPFLTIKDISNNELLRSTLSGTGLLDQIGVDQIARRAAVFSWAVIRELATTIEASAEGLSCG